MCSEKMTASPKKNALKRKTTYGYKSCQCRGDFKCLLYCIFSCYSYWGREEVVLIVTISLKMKTGFLIHTIPRQQLNLLCC